MDLVRKILGVLSAKGQVAQTVSVEIEGYSKEEIVYHLVLMEEAGLVDGVNMSTHSEGADYKPRRLTWSGHDFLDAAKDDTRWEQAKKIAGELGGVTFQMFRQILVSLLEQQVQKMTGL